MPKPLLFAPFWSSSVDQEDNSLSLFSLIEGTDVPVPEGEEVPEGAISPRQWVIVNVLEREQGDEGRSFEARTLLVGPNGKEPVDGVQPFSFPGEIRTVRNRANIQGFPVAPAGQYLLRLFVREEGSKAGWGDPVAEYPYYIKHVKKGSKPE